MDKVSDHLEKMSETGEIDTMFQDFIDAELEEADSIENHISERSITYCQKGS